MSCGAAPRIAVCFLLAPLCAQQAPPLQLSVDTRLVTIPVSVVDERRRPMGGLRAENFRVFDDGAAQPISHFDTDESPIALGLVFDTSASMRRTAPLAPLAMVQVLKHARPNDEFFLVEFSQTAKLVAPVTNDAEEISRNLARSGSYFRLPVCSAVCLSHSIAIGSAARSPRFTTASV